VPRPSESIKCARFFSVRFCDARSCRISLRVSTTSCMPSFTKARIDAICLSCSERCSAVFIPTFYQEIPCQCITRPCAAGVTSQKGYNTTAEFLHSVNEMESGARYSYSWRLNPLGAFEITHTSISTTDLATLEAFFNSMCGRFGSFIFLDPAGQPLPNI
jgi:hypothetical protein